MSKCSLLAVVVALVASACSGSLAGYETERGAVLSKVLTGIEVASCVDTALRKAAADQATADAATAATAPSPAPTPAQ